MWYFFTEILGRLNTLHIRFSLTQPLAIWFSLMLHVLSAGAGTLSQITRAVTGCYNLLILFISKCKRHGKPFGILEHHYQIYSSQKETVTLSIEVYSYLLI